MDEEKKARRAQKRRRREERRRRKQRVRYTKDAPLVLSGRVDVYEPRPPSVLRHLRRPLSALLRPLPVEPTSRRGRKAWRDARTALIVLGGVVAIGGGTMRSALIGGLILITAPALPMFPSTKMRWLSWIEGIGERRGRMRTPEVSIRFNGRGVSIEGEDVRRRVLTREGSFELRLRRARSGVALGVVLLKKSARSAQAWFVLADATGFPADLSALQELEEAPDLPVAVDLATLLGLHEALRPDDQPSLTDPQRA